MFLSLLFWTTEHRVLWLFVCVALAAFLESIGGYLGAPGWLPFLAIAVYFVPYIVVIAVIIVAIIGSSHADY